ncbi:MAG: nucleotidyl transferase AbiEii/AbiGii toxin family protein [Patescibacteria group bacterium]
MLEVKKHRQVMFEIITNIYRSSIGNFLGFKGGTMAYFFYGLDRFSVDLDFDLLDERKITEVTRIVSKILSDYGEIQDKTNKRFTLFWLLNYEKNNRNLKIEISKRKQEAVRYEIANFYGTDVKISKIEDSFATKLLACTTRNRTAYRDFYDVYFYLKKGIIPNEAIIKMETDKNLKNYLIYLNKYIQKNVSNHAILSGIGEFVTEKQKSWIRNHLKNELLNRINFLIDSIPNNH